MTRITITVDADPLSFSLSLFHLPGGCLLPPRPPVFQLLPPLLDLALKLGHLLQPLGLLLILLLIRFDLLPRHLPLQLLGSALRDVPRTEVAEPGLEHLLDDVADEVVEDHGRRHLGLELVAERHELHALVDFGDELHGADESQTGDADDAVEHGFVLGEGFAEGAALVVDGKGGDLLDELEEVDARVEQGGLELGFEVDLIGTADGAS